MNGCSPARSFGNYDAADNDAATVGSIEIDPNVNLMIEMILAGAGLAFMLSGVSAMQENAQ